MTTTKMAIQKGRTESSDYEEAIKELRGLDGDLPSPITVSIRSYVGQLRMWLGDERTRHGVTQKVLWQTAAKLKQLEDDLREELGEAVLEGM